MLVCSSQYDIQIYDGYESKCKAMNFFICNEKFSGLSKVISGQL